MGKYIILLAIFNIHFLCFSQQKHRIKKSIEYSYEYATDHWDTVKRTSTITYFDTAGNIEHYEDYIGDEKNGFRIHVSYYNSAGKVYKEINGKQGDAQLIIHEFDKFNNDIKCTCYRSENPDTIDEIYRYQLTYNDLNKIIEAVTYTKNPNSKDSTEMYHSKKKYRYNHSGRLIDETLYAEDNPFGYKYYYNSNGKLARVVYYTVGHYNDFGVANPDTVIDGEKVFSFNEKGFVTGSIEEIDGSYEEEQYITDDEGNSTETIYYREKNIPYLRFTYEYEYY